MSSGRSDRSRGAKTPPLFLLLQSDRSIYVHAMELKYQLSWHELAHRLIDDLVHNPGAGLPGILVMCRQYNVTRLTVERALGHLEELGVVEPALRRQKRQINLSKLQRVASSQGRMEKRIFFISDSPVNNLPYMARDIFDTMLSLCAQESLSLDYIQAPPRLADLRSLLMSLQPRGVILYTLMQDAADVVVDLKIPAIGIGTDHPSIPVFRASHSGLFIRAFQQAVATGHRRIIAPIWKTRAGVYDYLVGPLEKEFSKPPVSFSRRYNLPLIQGNLPQDFHAALRELFRYTPPTCMILPGVPQYLTAVSFFLKEGLRIPDEISVLLLSDDPLLQNVVPSVAHFTLYSDDMVGRAFHALQEQMSGLLSNVFTELVPVWKPGMSLTPPPKSR